MKKKVLIASAIIFVIIAILTIGWCLIVVIETSYKGLEFFIPLTFKREVTTLENGDIFNEEKLEKIYLSPWQAKRILKKIKNNSNWINGEIDEKVDRILNAKKYLSNFKCKKPNFEEDRKIFREISRNSIEAGKKIDKTKKTLFVIADEKSQSVSGEVDFASKGTQDLVNNIKLHFPNATTNIIDICPSADTIADTLYYGLKHEQVVFVVHAPIKAYAGISHFHKPMLSLMEGMKHLTSAIVVWGNPFAKDDLPKGSNVFLCYDFGEFANSLFEKLI